MKITLEVGPETTQVLEDEATRRGRTTNELAQQAVEAMIADLRNRRVPQSLDEIKPRVSPPPGKRIKDMLSNDPWPGDETDQELLAALKALD